MGQETRDTKERILDAAEVLFADRGFAATSLRTITAEAGVNLAAVNYHFGSKEMLVAAVFSRRLEPLNRERLSALERFEAASDRGCATPEQIVEAFIGPPLRLSRDPSLGGMVFIRLLGHAMNQPKDGVRSLVAAQFEEVGRRFAEAIERSIPGLPRVEAYWRVLYMAGAMAHAMVWSDELGRVSGGIRDPWDTDAMIGRLVPFLAAGLRVPAEVRVGGDS